MATGGVLHRVSYVPGLMKIKEEGRGVRGVFWGAALALALVGEKVVALELMHQDFVKILPKTCMVFSSFFLLPQNQTARGSTV
jgi:hypothetical protein